MKLEREATKMPKNNLTESEIDNLIENVEALFKQYIEVYGHGPKFLFFDVDTYFEWEIVMWKRFGIPPKSHSPKEKSFRTYQGCEIICFFSPNNERRIILA